MLNIAVLVSGGGTNLQAIIDAVDQGKITNGKIVRVISSKSGVFALDRAKKHAIQTAVFERSGYETKENFEADIISELRNCQADLIVLAGFMCVLSKNFIKTFENKIINVHPSLIPAFCGDGFYGLKVHRAALEYGVKITGATVHFVNEITDGGPVILQKATFVRSDDTEDTLQQRVMEECEWDILPGAINLICNGLIKIKNNRVILEEK